MKAWLTAILGIFTVAAASHAAELPGSTFEYKGWRGAAYTNDTDGRFSYCAISSPYKSGDTLLFSVNIDATIGIGVSNPHWALSVGQSLDVGFFVDNFDPHFATASAVHSNLVVATLPSENGLFEKLRRGRLLTIKTVQGDSLYNLDGTAASLKLALNCVVKYMNDGGKQKNRAFGNNTSSVVPSEVSVSSALERGQLVTMMTYVLNASGISDYKILLPEETPADLKSFPVVWTATNITGTLATYAVQSGETLTTAASTLISSDAPNCAGEFASGVTSNVAEGSARVSTLCRSEKGELRTDYSILQNEGYFFVFATLITADESKASNAEEYTDSEKLFRSAAFIINNSSR
jgi:hypothetical protein